MRQAAAWRIPVPSDEARRAAAPIARPVVNAFPIPHAPVDRFAAELEGQLDRRDFGLDWQAQLPSGGDVLDYAVTINVDLELVAEEV